MLLMPSEFGMQVLKDMFNAKKEKEIPTYQVGSRQLKLLLLQQLVDNRSFDRALWS